MMKRDSDGIPKIQKSCNIYSTTVDNLQDVKTFMTGVQSEEGDCLSGDHVSTLPERVDLILQQNDLTELLGLWREWEGTEQQTKFESEYRFIADLLRVEIDCDLIQAAVQFWDPSYRCFVFNQVDMIPTMEEYSVMLGFDKVSLSRTYRRPRKMSGLRKKLAHLMGVSKEVVDSYLNQEGISWDNLRGFILTHMNDEYGRNVMAMAIYGMVVFPKVLGRIEFAVVDLVDHIQHGTDPSSAIVADTIMSLNICRKTSGERFLGCAQLLSMWIHGHFECEISQFTEGYHETSSHIREFCTSTWPAQKSKEEWIQRLRKLISIEVTWKAPWMNCMPLIYRCGDKPWVPLIGLRGCVSYAPIMVGRQFGLQQFIPATNGLNQLEFPYGETGYLRKLDEISQDWHKVHKVSKGRQDDEGNEVAIGYLEWQTKRVKDVILPPEEKFGHPVGPESCDTTEMVLAKKKLEGENVELACQSQELLKEVERWKAEARQEGKEKQNMGMENDELKRAINDLEKDHSAVMNELKGCREENDNLQTKLHGERNEKEGLGISVARLEHELQMLQKAKETLEGENTEIARQNHELLKEVERLKAEARQEGKEKQQIRIENDKLRRAMDDLEKDYSAVMNELKGCREENGNLQTKLHGERNEKGGLGTSVARLQHELQLLRKANQINREEYNELLRMIH